MARGACILAPLGPILTADEAAFFRDADPWGFILFQRNCETPDQLRTLTASLREAVGHDAPVLIDQEGGRVQRMRAPHWREWLPPLDQAMAVSEADVGARAMYLRGLLIGSELVAHGVDVNCAPSADLAWPETHTFLRNRCYGETPLQVIQAARACAEGLLDAGCLPVLKHAPGHGRAQLDSHKELPRIDVPLTTLRETDFAPFRALSGLPLLMTAHIVVPEIDPDLPVTLSPDGIGFLREEFEFKGVLMSDDISMGALEAVSSDMADRVGRTLSAGCDLVLHCNGDLAEMQIVRDTAGEMSELAVSRAYLAVQARRTPIDIDIPALEAEFDSLMQSARD